MSNKHEKQYLADGLYAQYENAQICLSAENGITATDKVYLDNTTLHAFSNYLERNFGYKIVPVDNIRGES